MRKPSNMQVLVLEGPPRVRGQMHGEALRSLIGEHVDMMKSEIQEATGMDPDGYIRKFLEDTELLPAIERWAPDLLEEVRGIGEGANLDFDTALALQLPDEEWLYRRDEGFIRHSRDAGHCSGLAVFDEGDSPPLIAQNIDLPASREGFQVLLRIIEPESGAESLVFTLAGLIVLNGINNRPLAVCMNALLQLDHARNGLPVAFVLRGILAQRSLSDAVRFVRSIKHASGQNYVIGGAHGVVDLECSSGHVREYVPATAATRLVHTNHPLVNGDLGMHNDLLRRLSPEERECLAQQQVNYEARFDSLSRQLEASPRVVTVEGVKSMLSSHDSPEHPVCQHKRPGWDWVTVGCTIMVLSASPELHLAPGNPCSTEFAMYGFPAASEDRSPQEEGSDAIS
jgi:isopenicillin-N N-acyltransferase-like protein